MKLQVHKIKANLEYVIVFLTPTILHALKAGREATEMATAAAKKLKHKKKAAKDIHIEFSKQFKWNFYCVWAERAVLGGAKTSLKFNYDIKIQCMGKGISEVKEITRDLNHDLIFFFFFFQFCVPQYKVIV